MIDSKKNLILFTHGFPFGKGEQFLESEIIFLSQSFQKIIIYTYHSEGVKRKTPDNVHVNVLSKSGNSSVKKTIVFNLWLILRILILEVPKYKAYKIKGLKFHFNNLISEIRNGISMNTELTKYVSRDTILYAYWFGEIGQVLTFCKLVRTGKLKLYARVHGHDYDINRREGQLIPFRNYHMTKVSKIASISEYAINQIQSSYPRFNNLFSHRLGVSDSGESPTVDNKNKFHIVSCSTLIPLKRVHLIVEILKHFESEVTWTHFGDGPLREDLMSRIKILPSNVEVIFKGYVTNNEIIEFYKEHPIDIFINVSEFEGIPVSLMEAISFGIPIVGCNVCGVPEIVTSQTGLLLDRDFDTKVVAKEIIDYLTKDPQERKEIRKSVKSFWNDNFNSEVNYPFFIKEFLKK